VETAGCVDLIFITRLRRFRHTEPTFADVI
jgi:hypothetical protein